MNRTSAQGILKLAVIAFVLPLTVLITVSVIGGGWLGLGAGVAYFLYLGTKEGRGRYHNQCQQCGYLLTGNVSGVCPECWRES